jgi:hypothetical protein
MNEVIRQLGAAPSLEKALELFSSTVNPDEENETVVLKYSINKSFTRRNS